MLINANTPKTLSLLNHKQLLMHGFRFSKKKKDINNQICISDHFNHLKAS